MTTQTEQTNQVALWEPTAEDDGGLGGDSYKDIRLEFVQLNGQTGKFTFGRERNKGEDTITLVIMAKLTGSRAFFEKGKLGDPLCSSDNGIVPINQQQAAKINAGPSCGSCIYASWEKGKPDCSENVNLLAASPPDVEEDGTRGEPFPFILRLRGTSINVYKSMHTAIEMERRKRSKNSVKRPYFGFLVELGSEKVVDKEKGQAYHKLTWHIAGDTDQRDWATYNDMKHLYEARVSEVLAASGTAERAAVAEETATQGPVAVRPVTVPQLSFIRSLLERIGNTEADVPQLSGGIALTDLNRDQAHRLIEVLQLSERDLPAVDNRPRNNSDDITAPDDLPFPDTDPGFDDDENGNSGSKEELNQLDQDEAEPEDEGTGLPGASAEYAEDAALLAKMDTISPVVKLRNEILALAERDAIDRPALDNWAKSLFNKTVDDLNEEQAETLIDRINKRAAAIAGAPQAVKTQKSVAAMVAKKATTAAAAK